MGKLIVVVGNTGAGKTTLTRLLADRLGLVTGLEGHISRPFQSALAGGDRRAAFPNQIDYLLLRAEQELEIRRSPMPGIQDGGLDLDYQLFTRLFHERGLLSSPEFELCGRLYQTLRELLPPPDLIVYLNAPLDVLGSRFAQRGRAVEVARSRDLQELQSLLDAWLSGLSPSALATVDASIADPGYTAALPGLLARIRDVIESGSS